MSANLSKLFIGVNKKITNTCYFFVDIRDLRLLNNGADDGSNH